MCDYSLHNVKTRPAKVGDKLTTRQFGLGTRGFYAPEDASVAVCVLPGTELSFAEGVRRVLSWHWTNAVIGHKTAIFRQINQDNPRTQRRAGISRWPDRSAELAGRGSARHRSSVAGGATTGGACWY
jgi:hypothetical protein